jgi:phosphatidylglycerol lysyltransferase
MQAAVPETGSDLLRSTQNWRFVFSNAEMIVMGLRINADRLSVKSSLASRHHLKLWRRQAASDKVVNRERLHRFLLWLATLGTAGSGVLNIYSVIGAGLPARTRVLEKFFPLAFQNLSRYVTLVIGFALVTSSINIWKRKRRAWQLVISLSLLSVVFHLMKGIDYEAASVSLLLFLILWSTREQFTVKSSPPALRQALMRTIVGAFVVLCYASVGFYLLDKREFGIDFSVAEAVKDTLLIISLAGNSQLTPQTPYAYWFTDSIYLLTFTFIVYLGLAFFKPIIYRLHTLPRERLRATEIARQYGQSALDVFKLWPDKSFYFNETTNCFIAYAVGNNYALALADPVGPEDCMAETVRGFSNFCRSNDWAVAFYQVRSSYLSIYHKLGFKRLKIGDDAIVDLSRFSLDGKRGRRLRRNLKKFESNGFHVVQYQPPIPTEIIRAAKSISDDWLGLPGHRERQFSLGRFDEAYVGSSALYTLVDPEGTMIAFVNRIKSYRKGEATVDLMRHQREAPNGAMDYLFTRLFLDCKAEHFQSFSLGMAPLDGFYESDQPTLEERAVHYFVRHLNFIFSYSGLRYYKAKFADTWEPRYLIYQNILALPKIALALTKVSELSRHT